MGATVLSDEEDAVEYYGRRVSVVSYGSITKVTSILDSKARRAIVYLLATYGPLTLKELSEMLNLAPSTVYDHLKKLKEVGVIREAEEHPKRFKVEVYYKLNIPFFLASELRELEKNLGDLIDQFSKFIENAREIMAKSIKNINPRCLRYGDPSMFERAVSVLLVQIHLLVFYRYVNEPLVYVLINDLEESGSSASTS